MWEWFLTPLPKDIVFLCAVTLIVVSAIVLFLIGLIRGEADDKRR